MMFTSKHHLKTYGGCALTIGDDTVSPSDRIRNLGIHMDQHLSMTDHVTAVCATCNYHLYRLSSILHYLTTEAAKSAVNALVTSRLDYCNSLLHNIPLSQTAQLQRVQNNAARLITRTSVEGAALAASWEPNRLQNVGIVEPLSDKIWPNCAFYDKNMKFGIHVE